MSSDEERKPIDLSWLPASNAEEWLRELQDLRGLRMMLAGLALRHAKDASGAAVNNGPLAIDIASLQARVQQMIDQAYANETAIRDLAKASGTEDHSPASAQADSTAQATTPASARSALYVDASVLGRLHAAIRKWSDTNAKLKALLVSIGKMTNATTDEDVALVLVEAMEAVSAQWNEVTAVAHEVNFLADSCDPADAPASTGARVH
jgi:hypothetical protein